VVTAVVDEQLVPRSAREQAVAGADAVRLLRMYESVIAVRPLLGGNREFLESLLASCRVLAQVVADRRDGVPRDVVSTIKGWVAHQHADNAAVTARELVRAIDAAASSGGGRADPLFVRSLPKLADDYGRITVVFGPGIGLGDEITFAQLVRALVQRYADARTRVFTLYPGLWRALQSRVHEQQYRRRPLRPFSQLAVGGDRARELVVLADFELFALTGELVKRRPGRDVLEISLGRREVRLARGVSPWTHFEQLERPDLGNYSVLHDYAERLVGGSPLDLWRPFARPSPRPRRSRLSLLLNPLSSKPLPYTPEEWARLIRRIADATGSSPLHVLVNPGPDATGEAYAEAIRTRLERAGIAADLVTAGGGRPLTPFNALAAFVATAGSADLCLTLDTFAAHLAPLLSTPTVVVAYAENRQFWVPSPWAFYALLDEADARVPALAGRLLRNALGDVSPAARASGTNLAEATSRVERRGGSTALQALCSALAEALSATRGNGLASAEGAEWLRFWFRVASAERRDPLGPSALRSYVDAWVATDFYKLATAFTNVRRDWSAA
jgi:hypothetical protein